MGKPSMLYVSPRWPMRSGISEYSEALVRGLKEEFELTLLANNYTPESKEIKEQYSFLQYKKNKKYDSFDYIVYNFGNNPECHSFMYDMIQENPGYIILHDFVLYYLTVGYYADKDMLFQKIYELEGVDGIRKVKESLFNNHEKNLFAHKTLSASLPLNREILNLSKGVIIHSKYTETLVHKENPEINTLVIPLVRTYEERIKKGFKIDYDVYKALNIPAGAYIIGSAGMIAPTKQNRLVCEAVKMYNQSHSDKIYYLMVGDGNYVDQYLDEYIKKTGFLDNDDFYQATVSCDAIMNLRYPYHGESSATLIQCMEMGKPCVVTDIGWFGELPEDCVIHTRQELTAEELLHIIEDLKAGKYDAYSEAAKQYVKEHCDAGNIAKQIRQYLQRETTV